MTEILNLPIALESIRSNDKYREGLTQIAQDIRADIVSYKDNPNCSCRRKIHEFINKNKEIEPVKAFLETWKPQIPQLFISQEEFDAQQASKKEAQEKARKRFEEERKLNGSKSLPPRMQLGPDGKPIPPKNMVGHVVEIPATPSEYKTLIDHAQKERWVYRGMSLKDGKAADGSAIWLVFFF